MIGWDEIALLVGGAAAALIGALFVAISVKIDVISPSTELRNRGAQTLLLFASPLVAAVLLVIPEQSEIALGIELLALALVAGASAFALDRKAKHHRDTAAVARTLEIVTPNATTAILTGVAGILLLLGHETGLYFLVPAFLAALIGGITNAWLFLTKIRT